MGIKFQTGFGHYSTLGNRWDSVTSQATWGAAFGRDSTAGVQITSTATAGSQLPLRKNLNSNLSTIYFATAWKCDNLPTSGTKTLLTTYDNGTPQTSLSIRADGRFQFFRNITTAIGTVSSILVVPNVWYHLEANIIINNSGTLDFRINEVGDPNFPQFGVDTQNTANAYITQIAVGSEGGSTAIQSYDDVIIRDDGWSGDLKVKAFFPLGIGSTNSWSVVGASSSWQATDETAPNSDTDYISSSTVGDQTLFTFDTLPTSSVIHAVTPIPWVEKTDAGTAQFASEIRLSSTTYTGATQAASDSSYTYFPDVNMTSPATGITWTVSEWNSIEIGVVRTA